jgi:hypothetical protein
VRSGEAVTYREKATGRIVQAEQFLGFHHTPWPAGVETDETQQCYLNRAEGQRAVLHGRDWVVYKADWGYEAYEPNVFAACFEEVKT